MADFKRSGARRFYENRGNEFNRQDTKRPVFAQKKWNGPSRPTTMHKATCAQCGNSCEVPFRPFDNRLVYCNDCFQDKKGAQDNKSYDRFSRKSYSDNRSFTRSGSNRNFGDGDSNDIKGQLELLSAKIDRLIRTVEAMASAGPVSPETGMNEGAAGDSHAKPKKEGKKAVKKYKRPF